MFFMHDKNISKDSTLLHHDGPGPPPRILVVDDDDIIRDLNTQMLIHSGYHVDSVEDGAVAWKALNTGTYDLMITDNHMPNVSGLELLRKLKLNPGRMHLAVIMATGIMPKEEFARYPWLRPSAVLLKPYTLTELLEQVNMVLRSIDRQFELLPT